MSAFIGAFLSLGNLLNVALSIAVIGILGVGMTAVILTGGIDLSVGSGVGARRHRGASRPRGGR